MKDLIILILTLGLEEEVKPARFLPKVCHKINDKTIIENVIENCLRLNPNKIILYVSKNNIQCINKVLKYTNYSKMVSFCIFDNELNGQRRLSIGQRCFSDKNILVVPGNMPLLSTKTLFRMISENRNVKISDDLFYLKKESMNMLDQVHEITNESFSIPNIELKRVNTKGDLEEIESHVNDRKKKYSLSGKN